jgi:outer membrane protein assembly factor BamB
VACLIAAGSCVHEPTAPAIPAIADELFGKGNTRWFVADTLGGGGMRPAMAEGLIYLIIRGELTALDQATGRIVWHQPTLDAKNAVIVGDYVATILGGIAVHDRRTGALRRTVVTQSISFTSNLVTDGARLYAGTYYGDVVAVNPATGNEEWHTTLATGTSTRVVGIGLLGERIAVTMTYDRPMGVFIDSGMVAVLDRASGSLIWRRAFASTPLERSVTYIDPPVLAGDVVAAVTSGHFVHGFDASSGTELWSYDAARGDPNEGSYGIATCDGAVVFSGGDLGLASIDAQTGAENWRVPDLQQGSMYWVDCGFGTVMALASYLTIVDARTGALVRKVEGSRYLQIFVETAARDQNTLYVSTDRGYGAIKLP